MKPRYLDFLIGNWTGMPLLNTSRSYDYTRDEVGVIYDREDIHVWPHTWDRHNVAAIVITLSDD